jgi:hypothetical protein
VIISMLRNAAARGGRLLEFVRAASALPWERAQCASGELSSASNDHALTEIQSPAVSVLGEQGTAPTSAIAQSTRHHASSSFIGVKSRREELGNSWGLPVGGAWCVARRGLRTAAAKTTATSQQEEDDADQIASAWLVSAKPRLQWCNSLPQTRIAPHGVRAGDLFDSMQRSNLTPAAIVSQLDQHIIGQVCCCWGLSVATWRTTVLVPTTISRMRACVRDPHDCTQEDAKRAVAVALRNRWRRAQLPQLVADEVMPKNILMVGEWQL